MSRASEYRTRKRGREREQLKQVFVEATGATFIVRPVKFDQWIMAGRLPDNQVKEVLAAWHQLALMAEGPNGIPDTVSTDQVFVSLQMLRDWIVYVCVSPRIVVGDVEADEDKDEIHFIELDEAERNALIKFCMTGVGTAPNGSVTAEAVTHFS